MPESFTPPSLHPDTPVVSAVQDAPASWWRSMRFSGFTVLMLMVLVLFVVIVSPGARIFIEQRQQIADLQRSVELKTAENQSLSAEVARWSDPTYLRAQARERLYYVMPGETSFLVINDTATGNSPGDAVVSPVAEPTKIEWLSALFVSGMTAGLSTQTVSQLEKSGEIRP